MQKLFSIGKEPLNYSREITGGLINFLAIAYIIVVSPIIMNATGHAFPITPNITSTIITIIIMTFIASFLIKLPFVIAPGMGINAIVSYTLVLHDKLPIPTVLGIIFWSSLILFIVSITPLRQKIITAIPENIQIALSVGIGLFLMLVGMKNAGIIISNANTIIGIGKTNTATILCYFGFIFTAFLFIKRKFYAMILPIFVVTILSFLLGEDSFPKNIFAAPDFGLFMQINFFNCLKLSIIPSILSLFLVSFFDSTSSVIGLLSQLNYRNDAEKDSYLKRSLATDGLAGIVSSVVGTSAGVVFIESSAAIQSGAKTGFASLITAILCVPFLFLSPLISTIPAIATAPVLILVGILMMDNIKRIKFNNLEDFISVILTIVMMPFCFSITAGAVFGITSYTLLKLILGKFDELNPTIIMVAICCSSWFAIA